LQSPGKSKELQQQLNKAEYALASIRFFAFNCLGKVFGRKNREKMIAKIEEEMKNAGFLEK